MSPGEPDAAAPGGAEVPSGEGAGRERREPAARPPDGGERPEPQQFPEDPVDEASEESFPASDPPAHGGTT